MIQRPDQRVAVFIDTQNMYHSAKNIFNAKVSFPSLVEGVVGARMLSRAIAYVAKSKENTEQAFFEALLQNGIELKIKDIQEFSSGAKKANQDIDMAVDAIAIARKVDVVVLATGDGDFVPLIHYLKAQGVICEVAAFGESTNAELKEVADNFLDLSHEPERFLIQTHRKTSSPRGKNVKEKEEKPPVQRNVRITF